MDMFDQITPLYTQPGFWLRLLGMVLLWYVLALAFAHLFFGAGREAVASAKGAMWLALGIVLVVLGLSAWFWWSPSELLYTLVITVTFLLVTLLILWAFTRLGSRE